jgi:manganese/zinc/iron transport system substrate-binding protein
MLKTLMYKTFTLLFIAILLTSCDSSKIKTNGRVTILTTTGMIGDAVKHLTSNFADVNVMMGPGVDPHLYKASQGDMQLLSNADVIVYNGLHLEGKLVEILQKTGETKPTIAIGDYIESESILRSQNGGEAPDPHIWMDPSIWNEGLRGLKDTLRSLFPEHAESIQLKYTQYEDSLRNLVVEIDSLMHTIPPHNRVLITSHDAFRYFGRAFEVEVQGLQGISTVSEYGLRDVKMMVDLIINREIKAVFIESSVSQKSLESVIEGCKSRNFQIKIGGMLFSDSMGAEGSPEGTYVGMLRHNAVTITNALK